LRHIAAGGFIMGSGWSNEEQPRHLVTISSGFCMSQTPVTQRQFSAIMGRNPARFQNSGPHAPVEQVSWDECQAFLTKMNTLRFGYKYYGDRGRRQIREFFSDATLRFRLPSEAEWEYACRAGTQTDIPTGGSLTPLVLDEIAWYGGRLDHSPCAPSAAILSGTHPVMRKAPNAWGLYDMLGNVWEWCEDTWHDNYEGAPADGTAWMSDSLIQPLHVTRGGSWASDAHCCRSACRITACGPASDVGFRLVLAGAGRAPLWDGLASKEDKLASEENRLASEEARILGRRALNLDL
jgi:formylglycine-generating enzyme required for sulfatase activity